MRGDVLCIIMRLTTTIQFYSFHLLTISAIVFTPSQSSQLRERIAMDDGINSQRLVNHVSLILCHLNVKSIYLFFDDALRSPIVEQLMRGNRVCVPPIVTLIGLVAILKQFLLCVCTMSTEDDRNTVFNWKIAKQFILMRDRCSPRWKWREKINNRCWHWMARRKKCCWIN